MKTRGGLTGRLVRLVIAVVGITALVVGTASVYLVDRSLRTRLVDETVAAIEFNLGVLAPAVGLDADSDRAAVDESGILNRFLSRGVDGAWVEFPEGDVLVAPRGPGPLSVSPEMRAIITAGNIGYEFVDLPQGRVLVGGAKLPQDGPTFFIATSADIIDESTTRLILTVSGVGLGVLLIGAVVATGVARRILQPVSAARGAAERLAKGDLSARLDVPGTDEFSQLSNAFNTMAASLQETIQALSDAQAREKRFVADVSHELRTPLTGIVNEAAMLRSRLADGGPVGDDERTIADLLEGDVGRLRKLVEELLEISRLESDATPPSPSPVDLNRFLAALIADRHPDAILSGSLPQPVSIDRHGVERIVGNLLDNARTHAGSAEVAVTVSPTPDGVEIRVADSGPGVDQSALPTLFDRFVTTNPARGSGSGLGLSIAAEHARRLGGSISAHNRPGGGLEFIVALPVAELLHDRESRETSSGDPDINDTKGV